MKVKKSELMFYTAYTMYYIMNMLYTTRIGNFFGVISLNDLSLIVMPIVLGCLLITFLKSISKRYWFAFGTIFFAAVAIAYNSGVRAVLISIMFILCARMIDAYAAQSLAKYYWIWETNIYYNRCRNSNLSCGRYSLMRKLFGLPKLESENFRVNNDYVFLYRILRKILMIENYLYDVKRGGDKTEIHF